MTLRLEPVTLANREFLDEVDPGAHALSWVHSSWYWHQVSLDRPRVQFRLVHEGEAVVGMVAWGPAYADEELTELVPGRYELTHLVVDHRHQRRGVGAAVSRAVLRMLAAEPDCREVVVAHHPDNAASRSMFTALGLRPAEERNYDGDPLLVAAPADLA
ncbi:hypothetical protein GCM10009623_08520 [Nocardioides aestuarii]|uniref:GNAT family N-acetyltransferase n=1 Tax=Nocardioides aestuarii TaxID=252231 RepID=A0ABW4TEZ0_9ACTN